MLRKRRLSTSTAAWVHVVAAALLCAGCSGGPLPDSIPVATASIAGSQATPDSEVAAAVDRVLGAADHPALRWKQISDVAASLKPLYEAEPDRLLWFAGSTPAAPLAPTVATLALAADYGLDPTDYDAALLAERWTAVQAGEVSAVARAHFDLGVSVAVARMLKAVHLGRIDPATMNWGYTVASKDFDVVAAIRGAGPNKTLGAILDSLEPRIAHYSRARRALATYRRLAAAGEPEPVPDLPKRAPKLEPGKSWASMAMLSARLRALGDLPADPRPPSDIYAGPIVAAVKRFQQRHGLEADGIVGAGTLRALNVPLARRVRQIELAMERMRWLPQLSDRPNVFVNLPLFRMWASDPVTGDEPLRMNVVVGKSLNHQTPLFIEEMEYVVFRPHWYPPRSITVDEIVPHVRRDPSYFEREALEIVASGDDDAQPLPVTSENLAAVVEGKLYIRQKPGPENSLGLAKFIFPNDENVYMHGTPAQQLFSRVRRDFSHGCIRLEDPAGFAEWVLRDQPEWTRARIDEAMQGERPTRVNLKEGLTVVLFYDTVHVNSENVVHFVDDIYGHDRELDAALTRGYPYPVHSR
jgi:murein L,D-transpeptidase YcbB/YkuD